MKQRAIRIGSYLRNPQRVIRYPIYLASVFVSRWSYHQDSIYILGAPIQKRAAPRSDICVIATSDTRVLEDFIRQRDELEPEWGRGGYRAAIELRFSRGDICFCGKVGREVISVVFAAFREVDLDHVRFSWPVPDGGIGIIDAFTLPKYRGMHAYESIYTGFINHYSGSAFKTVYGFIHPKNKISLLVHDRLGLNHIILEAKSWQRFGFKRKWFEKRDLYIKGILPEDQTTTRRGTDAGGAIGC